MKYLIHLFLVMLTLSGNAQTVFYSNDLTKDEIWGLVDDRDKWKKRSEALETELGKARKVNDRAAVYKANQQMYRLRTQLEAVQRLSQAEKERLEGQLAQLKKDATKNARTIADLQQRIAELNQTIQEQQRLIVNMQDEIVHLRQKVTDQDLEIQNRLLELEYARLLTCRNGADITVLTNKRKRVQSGLRANNKVLRARYFNKKKQFVVQAAHYRLFDELEKSRDFYPKATFYLYNTTNNTAIVNDKSFVLTQSEVPKPKRKGELPESARQGVAFWGNSEINLSHKLNKGNYYYLLVIDERVTVMDFFEMK